jgi:hypothetical protein
METLRYFSSDGRLGIWAPKLKSKIAGEVERDEKSRQRYAFPTSGAPSAEPGSHVRVTGAFLRALEDSALQEQISKLALDFRAVTPPGQLPDDSLTPEQRSILARRPTTLVTAGAAAFHRDEGQEQRTMTVVPSGDSLAGLPGTVDTERSDLRRLAGTQSGDAGAALRFWLDGHSGQEIADLLGVKRSTAYELVRSGARKVTADLELERLSEAA